MLDQTTVELFEQSGLTTREAQVFSALLGLGHAEVGDIAPHVPMSRANVYAVLDKLKARGYVSELSDSKVRRFVASDPAKLSRHLNHSAKMFREMLPYLQTLVERGGPKPRMQYFEGKKGLLSVYHEITQFSKADFICSIARYRKFIPEEVDSWMRMYEKESKGTLYARNILTDTPEDREFASAFPNPEQHARFFPKGLQLDLDLSLYGDNIAISSLREPLFITVLHSSNLARSFATIFELLWAAHMPTERLKKR